MKQLIQAAEQAWYAYAHQTCLIRYAAVQTNKTSPMKHANKRNVLRFWSNVWRPSNFIKHNQTRLSAIKHEQAAPNSTKQGVQTAPFLLTKQCLMVFGRQTFIVCSSPKNLDIKLVFAPYKIKINNLFSAKDALSKLSQSSVVYKFSSADCSALMSARQTDDISLRVFVNS